MSTCICYSELTWFMYTWFMTRLQDIKSSSEAELDNQKVTPHVYSI